MRDGQNNRQRDTAHECQLTAGVTGLIGERGAAGGQVIGSVVELYTEGWWKDDEQQDKFPFNSNWVSHNLDI